MITYTFVISLENLSPDFDGTFEGETFALAVRQIILACGSLANEIELPVVGVENVENKEEMRYLVVNLGYEKMRISMRTALRKGKIIAHLVL